MKLIAVVFLYLLVGVIADSEFQLLDDNEAVLDGLLDLRDFKLGADDLAKPDNVSVSTDALLNVPQLLKKYGYPSEIHKVQTADGYILEMHRIPRKGGIPVMLVHGLLDSSAGFVISGPKRALAYILSDLGYDVWLANCRGNSYSRQHIYLSDKQSAFWDFSFHELGVFDIPALIDYIVLHTGFDKIHYIAHSQGSTALFVMCDQRPGYCDKLLSVNALAPTAYVQHVTSPPIKLLSTFVDQLEFIAKIFGLKEFMPTNDIFTMAGQVLCKKEAITQPLCTNILFLICGYDSDQLNKTMVPVILAHIPAGASVKQLVHYGQMVKSGMYRMFDHGWFRNLGKYGSIHPPNYSFARVTAPVALHYSMNDWLSDARDVIRLSNELPNLYARYLVPIPKFNHMDFLFGITSKTAVYDKIIKIMQDLEKK